MSINIDDIRLKSNINFNQTLIITEKSFFFTILGFTQSHSGLLNDIEGFIQKVPVKYEYDQPIIIIGIEKIPL